MAGRVLGIPLPSLPTSQVSAAIGGVASLGAQLGLGSYSERLARQSLASLWDAVKGLELDKGLQYGADVAGRSLQDSSAGLASGGGGGRLSEMTGEAYKSIHAFVTTGEHAKLVLQATCTR